MAGKNRTLLITAIVGMWITCVSVNGQCAGGMITDIKISPDSRRVVIQTDIVGQPASRLDGNGRLIIDFPGFELGDIPKVTRATERTGLEVKATRQRQGTQLAVEFGGSPVPEHKIANMGNCVVLMLAEWTPKPSAELAEPRAANPQPAPPRQRHKASSRSGSAPAKIASAPENSSLEIKSADVVNGVIVLKVVDKHKPAAAFHVKLGVDLDRMGFNSANITKAPGKRPEPQRHEPRDDNPWSGPAAIGPRRAAP